MREPSVVIAGAGLFGLTAALALRRRGYRVTVCEAGTPPRVEAASTDVSKLVRMDYGDDALHTALGARAIAGWTEWNVRWGAPLYHADGVLVVSRAPLEPGGFEHDSLASVTAHGAPAERLTGAALATRFPDWAAAGYVDGYFNPVGGWVESGAVVTRLVAEAAAAGIALRAGTPVAGLLERGARVLGLHTRSGERLEADHTLVAAGAWTAALLPHLAEVLQSTAQPVILYRPRRPDRFRAPGFPPWAADVARTGWYGFPATASGLVKIGHHGTGRRAGPDTPREVTESERSRFRQFVAESLPALADAPEAEARLCFYCDTADGDFWIDRDADRPGLVVAAGDSGHAFKFAPVLGDLVADVLEGRPPPWAARFAARRQRTATEAARAGHPSLGTTT